MANPSFGMWQQEISSMTASVDEDGTIYNRHRVLWKRKLFAIDANGNMKMVAFNNCNRWLLEQWSRVKAQSSVWDSCPRDSKYVYCGNHGTIGSLVTFDKSTVNVWHYLPMAHQPCRRDFM
jgi:hypothetical protein